MKPGDPANYWSHSLATPDGSGDVDWLAASGSVDVEWLMDGEISGWYNGFTDDYQTIPPSLPLTTIPAPRRPGTWHSTPGNDTGFPDSTLKTDSKLK